MRSNNLIRAHKIRLYPNNKQKTYFAKACGTARFAYNWGLSEWMRLREAGESVSEGLLRKRLNEIKHEKYPWMSEVTKCAPQLAIKDDLNRAFQNYFSKRSNFPKFHKKGVRDSFSLSNDQFKVRDGFVRIPKLGDVRLAESLRFTGKILSATVSRTADIWYVSIQVELEDNPTPTCENQAVGVDFGVKSLAALSDGNVVSSSKASRKYESKLRKLNKELSRRKGAKKGEEKSANFRKTRVKLSRLYLKIANLRADETHKLTTMLTRKHSLIAVEDLNVKGMMSNHKLARSIADAAFSEAKRQLLYKAEATHSQVVVVDRWFPSSKICSNCGAVKADLTLSERTYHCEECGFICDRDINAAKNLLKYANTHVDMDAVSYTV